MQSRGNWLLYRTRFSPTLLIIRLLLNFKRHFLCHTALCACKVASMPFPGPLAYAEESGIGVGLLPMMYSHYQQAVLSI